MTKYLILAAVVFTLPVLAKEPNADLELAHRLENAFVAVADKASASVVVIMVEVKATPVTDAEDIDPEQYRKDPFEYFFRKYHKGQPVPRRKVEGQGSGIIFRKDGYILTNSHVVDSADKITVRLQDGRELTGTVIGNDARTDVAVIKVDAKDLPAAQLGDSDKIRVGQWAIAIGAPFELEYSFTVGFVSAKGRSAVLTRSGTAYEDYIQTDASINPGNSGGPLCDIDGRVIGINTLIQGMNTGIGFAIPINMARDIAGQLIDKGHITRPWIGIGIDPLTLHPGLSETLKDGAVVTHIEPGAPAAASDLKMADIITAVDGVPVKSTREMQQQVLKHKIGDKLVLDVVRDDKPLKITIATAEMTERQIADAGKESVPEKGVSAFGLTVQSLTKELAKQFDSTAETGVIVTEVEENSVAAEKGIQHGDIITEVNRVPVTTAEQFQAAVAKADPKKGVLLFLMRDGAATFEVLKAQ